MPRAKKEPRAQTERTERRRKRGDTVIDGRKLVLRDEDRDPNYEYRWAADRSGRVQALHDQEWDVVEGKEQPHGGSQESGNPYNMVLMKKRKDWFEEDRKEKLKPADEIDEHLRRGQAGNIVAERAGADASNFYTPSGGGMEVKQGYKP